jgi:hypothetical protein
VASGILESGTWNLEFGINISGKNKNLAQLIAPELFPLSLFHLTTLPPYHFSTSLSGIFFDFPD